MSTLSRMILIFMVCCTAGCSSMRFPGVFRIDIPQGNILTAENVSNLKLGMTQRQAEYLMGTAMVQDPFSPGRWDYLYRLELGSGIVLENQITLYFENDTLVRIDDTKYRNDTEFVLDMLDKIRDQAQLEKLRKPLPTSKDAIPPK